MPDWSYHPVFRPVLFRLPAPWARDFVLGLMGLVAAIPFGIGPWIIELLGRMTPPGALRCSGFGLSFPSPVGYSTCLDVHALGLGPLSRFGHGFLEVGPVTVEPRAASAPVKREIGPQAVWVPDPPANDGLAATARRLAKVAPLPVPLGVRLGSVPELPPAERTAQCRRMVAELSPHASFFTLETRAEAAAPRLDPAEWKAHLGGVLEAARASSPPRPVLLCLAPDVEPARMDELIGPAVELGITGVVVGGGIRADGGRRLGRPAREPGLEAIRGLRRRWGDRLTLVGSGGIHEPADALRLMRAGAALVQLDTGLVYAGPGLTKRINELLASAQERLPAGEGKPAPAAEQAGPSGWLGGTLLGAAMAAGGALLWALAGVQGRAETGAVLLALGLALGQLALHGVRSGEDWAKATFATGGVVGLAAALAGWALARPLEPLLAGAWVGLAALFALGLRGKPRGPGKQANLWNDWQWYASVWGELLFVVVGSMATLSGLSRALASGFSGGADRAAFFGLVAAGGLTILLIALWGFRQGARWVWWTLALMAAPPLAAALLAPPGWREAWPFPSSTLAACGLAYAVGLLLAYPHLCRTGGPASLEGELRASPTAGAPGPS